MTKIKKKEDLILSCLRKDSRMPLTKMSKKTGIPVSTIFDKIKNTKLIKKNTALLDFDKLGYSTCAKIIIKVEKESKEEIRRYLISHNNINSLLKINNGYDFLFEAIFHNIKEIEEFIEDLEEKFIITQKQVFYIMEDVKRECFIPS